MQQYNLYRYGAVRDRGRGHPRQRPGEGHRQARQADAAFAARAHADGLRVTETHARTVDFAEPGPGADRNHIPNASTHADGHRRVHADARTEQNRRTGATLHAVRGRSFHSSAYSRANPVHSEPRPHQRLLARRLAPHPRRRARDQRLVPRRLGPAPRRRAQDQRLVPRRLGPDPPRLRQRRPRGFRVWDRLRRRPQRHSHAVHGRRSHARPGRHGRGPRGRRSRSRRGRTTPGGPRVRGSPWRP